MLSIVLGIGLIAYSLFTNYELGVWKIAPMAVHNLFDIGAGALLAASPWLFGFADDGAKVWGPFVVVGVAAVFLGLTTKQQGGYGYRKTAAARPPPPTRGRRFGRGWAPTHPPFRRVLYTITRSDTRRKTWARKDPLELSGLSPRQRLPSRCS